MVILDYLSNPIILAIVLSLLEAVLRLIPTSKDVSIINNVIVLLDYFFSLIPNRSSDLRHRRSTFNVNVNKVVNELGDQVVEEMEDKTVVRKVVGKLFRRK
jgi:hypothetical protein